MLALSFLRTLLRSRRVTSIITIIIMAIMDLPWITIIGAQYLMIPERMTRDQSLISSCCTISLGSTLLKNMVLH